MNDLAVSHLIDHPLEEDMRGFFDPKKTRQWVLDAAKNGYQKKLDGFESKNFKLQVSDLGYDPDHKGFTLKEQQDAIMNKHDLTVPLKATIKLINKESGEVVDTKKTTLARVPWITPQNTSIINGGAYTTITQQRLKPGIYTRIKSTGEPEAHINVLAGSGLGGKIHFDPEKAIFNLELGSTKIRLYGILHDLGIPDKDIEAAWGNETYLRNKQAYDGTEIIKYHDKVFIK